MGITVLQLMGEMMPGKGASCPELHNPCEPSPEPKTLASSRPCTAPALKEARVGVI